MKRYYRCFTVNRHDGKDGGRNVYFDVYSVPARCSNDGLNASGIIFVTGFLWINRGTGRFFGEHKAYVERVCRTWNLVLLAADLAGLTLDCPPLILADAVEDAGEPRLAELLRTEYAQARSELDGSLLPAAIPVLPVGAPDHSCIVV
jgi:hypothetical protein